MKSPQVANRARNSRSGWIIVSVVLSGILVSFVLYQTLRWQEERLVTEDFKHRCSDRMKSIESQFESGARLVHSVAAFMQSSSDVTSAEFQTFTDHLLSERSSIHAISWNPRISAGDLAEHVAAAKSTFPAYELRQLRPDGVIETIDLSSQGIADSRDFFVVHLIEPLEPNRTALGLDIASEAVRRDALDRACDTGNLIATGRIRLVQETGSQFGVLVITPVYRERTGTDSAVRTRNDVAGVIVGVFRIGETVEAAMNNLDAAGIDVQLLDESAPPGRQLLYFHSSRLRAHPLAANEQRKLVQTQPARESSSFEFCGRNWTLYCNPIDGYSASRRTWLPQTALGGGLFVTFVLAGYIYGQARLTSQLRHEIVVRTQAEEHARESEQRFRSLTEKLPVGIFMNDSEGNNQFANELCLRLIGLTSDEAMKFGWTKSIHPDDRDRVVESFTRAVQAGSHFETENRLRVDGKNYWVHALAIPRRDDHGKIIGYMGSLMDITQRKQAEMDLKRAQDALQASEAKYRTIVETTQEWIWEMDCEGVHTFSNGAIERILGYRIAEVVGKSCFSLMHEEDRERIKKRLLALMNNATGWTGRTIRWRHKQGGIRYLESNAVPILDSQGRLAGYRGADRDITARVEAEEQLAKHQQSLAHMSRLSTMGEMVAGIAHEINQPLFAISNFSMAASNVLKTIRLDCDAPIEEWLRQIGVQAVRCGDIIRRLRGFVTKDKQERGLIDLNNVVRDSVALIASDRRHLASVIDCRLPDPGPQVYASEVQLQQVLVNLLRNACDSTHETATPKIRVSVKRHGDGVRLTVEDNGRGIQEQQRAKVFDAFFTTKMKGIGLGLAISKSIVEAHDGKLWLDAETPSGATFHVELPVPNPAEDGNE